METATEFKNSYVLTCETSIISLKKEEKKKVELFYISSFFQACKFIVHYNLISMGEVVGFYFYQLWRQEF